DDAVSGDELASGHLAEASRADGHPRQPGAPVGRNRGGRRYHRRPGASAGVRKAPLILAAVAGLVCLHAESFESLAFLQGQWSAEGGSFILRPELDGKVLVRHNKSGRHEDLMVIYGSRADYWDNEGHVIHYAVTADGKSAVFLSDPDAGGRRYR